MVRDKLRRRPHKDESTDAGRRGGATRRSGAHVRLWEDLEVKLMIINLVDIQDFFPYSQLL
jgi:hypothetical protein